MKITAHLGVRDEIELLEAALDHLYRIGVDHVIAFDMGSQDGTVELLQQRQSDRLELVRLRNDTPRQELAQRTVESVRATCADWVLFVDADEFWMPATGSLRDCAALPRADVISVPRFNVPLLPDGIAAPLPPLPPDYDRVFLYARAVPDFRAYMQANPEVPWISGVPMPKVLSRVDLIQEVTMGGHDVVSIGGRAVPRETATDAVIAHVPFTTASRFDKRLGNIREFFDLSPHYLQGEQGWHWRRLDVLARQNQGDEEFRRQVLDRDAFEAAVRDGAISSAASLMQPAEAR